MMGSEKCIQTYASGIRPGNENDMGRVYVDDGELGAVKMMSTWRGLGSLHRGEEGLGCTQGS